MCVGREGGNRSRQKRAREHANTCMCELVRQGTDNIVTASGEETGGVSLPSPLPPPPAASHWCVCVRDERVFLRGRDGGAR